MSEQLLKIKSSSNGYKHFEAKIDGINDNRSVVYGVVIDKNNKPVKDAVVKLILLEDPSEPTSIVPITHTFTDEYGQFLFGPLTPDKTYLIKVWYNDILIRKIEVKEPDVRPSCFVIRESYNPIDDEEKVHSTQDDLPDYHSAR